MSRLTRRLALAGCLALSTLALAAAANADDYPSRPIRMIAPFAAGGPADLIARAIAPGMSAYLKQSVVIENRTGAGGAVGVDATLKAPPDGYTIGVTGPGALTVSPFMTSVPYDPVRDVALIMRVAQVNGVIVVAADSPYKTLADLINAAKAAPGKLSFGSAGAGTTTQMAGELLNMEANIKLVHVPYRGAAPAANDLLGGHIQTMMPDLPGVLSLIQAGKVRALAVTSKTRSIYLPDTPTTAEAGWPNVLSDSWYGVIAPAATPDAIKTRLQEAVTAAMKTPEFAAQIKTQGALVAPAAPKEFAAVVAAEQARWKRVIETTGAKME
jgi:tripartite-type tricarboxylate transporter receptor subunit TctC